MHGNKDLQFLYTELLKKFKTIAVSLTEQCEQYNIKIQKNKMNDLAFSLGYLKLEYFYKCNITLLDSQKYDTVQ